MPKITFIDFEGNQQTVEGEVGESVMSAAVENDVPGIDADCGGACACATCHCYVSEEWTDVIEAPDAMEQEMLSMAEEVKDNSRLACQIKIVEACDGLIVTTPENQS